MSLKKIGGLNVLSLNNYSTKCEKYDIITSRIHKMIFYNLKYFPKFYEKIKNQIEYIIFPSTIIFERMLFNIISHLSHDYRQIQASKLLTFKLYDHLMNRLFWIIIDYVSASNF